MSTETWAAVIGVGTYFAFKSIDRLFKVIDHWLRQHGIDEESDDVD